MEMELICDAGLVKSARRGERTAFDELLRRHYEMARRIALSFAAIPEDADDLVQEAFVTAYAHLGQLDDPERFGSWLAAIMRNQGRMWHRRRRVQPALLPLDGEESEASSHVDKASARTAREAARRDSVREAVADALASLCSQQSQVVRLHYLEGYDYGETASLLNVPVAAVRGRLDRARSVLRRELSDMAGVSSKGWELSPRDLDAVRFASTVACTDPDRRALNALLITGKGQLVSTDTHRLFVYSGSSLEQVPRALIDAGFGRELRDTYRDSRRGRLTIDEDEVVLRLTEGWEIKAPLVEEVFPNWENIIPAEWSLKAVAKSGDWLQALGLLASHREGRTDDGSIPRVVVVISPVEGRITLREGRESSEAAPNEIAREVSVWFHAEFPSSGQELIIALNPIYLEQAVRFLGLDPDAKVELNANAHDGPVLTQSAGGGDAFMLTMPMQRAYSASG